ncbi:MAG TPA: LamG-like jellyroll fold domain-containing protein [Candidatus Bathyarchaeia archaeon]|nr:LamG-like jellyroll fold domain-containing protein [Candidatus Bathyarchaeia archaeon]
MNNRRLKFKSPNAFFGFTLIELLVTISITGLMLSIGLANYNRINRNQIFQQATDVVLEDLRLAQDKAISGEKPASCLSSEITLDGYRFIFDSPATYAIRAVCNGVNQDPPVKTASLRGETRKESGPDEIFFRVLSLGVDLGGFESRIVSLGGYGQSLQIVVTDSGEIYPASVPTETPVSELTATPVLTETPLPTSTPIATPTPVPTLTPSPSPSPSPTPVPTSTPNPTPTPTPNVGQLLYTTLDNLSAVTSPEVGTGGNISGGSFVSGKVGNGYQADATGEYGYFPLTGNVNAQRGTIDFWYKRTSAPSSLGRFFADSKVNDPADVYFGLWRGGSDTVIRFLTDGSGNRIDWTGVINVFDGNWHHLRLTYDTVSHLFNLYIDGISQGEKTSPMGAIDTSVNLCLGNNSLGQRYVGGVLDEFNIYSEISIPWPELTPTPTPTPIGQSLFANSPSLLDFEECTLVDYDTTGTRYHGYNQASNTQAKSGSCSHHSWTTDGTDGDEAYGQKTITWPAGNHAYLRFSVYIDDTGPNSFSQGAILGGLYKSNGSPWTFVAAVHQRCSDNLLRLMAYDGGAYRDTGITFDAAKDTWYDIEIMYDLSGTNARAEMWINNISRGAWEGSGKPNSPNVIRAGALNYNWAVDVWQNLYLDDINCRDQKIGI